MLCGRLTRARVTFKSDVIIILNLKRTMVLTVMRRRLSVYRVHLHVPRSVSDSLCYLESAWQGMHSSTAVSGGGVCWMIMPDNTSVNSRDDRPFCRVRCSCFCRAVSCHSCFLSIPARARSTSEAHASWHFACILLLQPSFRPPTVAVMQCVYVQASVSSIAPATPLCI